MNSNTHSPQRSGRLAALTAEIDALLDQDLDGLTDVALAEDTQELRRLADRLEGGWLRHLAAVDARGAAGADQDRQFGSTASWLRTRLRMAATPAATTVRTARALFCGPLPEAGTALCAGELSVAHTEVLATSTLHLADQVIEQAEPKLLDAARRLDPPGLRKAVTYLEYTVDPDGADQRAQRRYERRGVWFSVTIDRMVVVHGTMTPEAGQTVQAALDPLARPADAADTRSGGQRTADAVEELARRQLENGQLPKSGGVRPQLSVIVDLHSLDRLDGRDRLDGLDSRDSPEGLEGHRVGRLGGDMGGAGPWNPGLPAPGL
jgi:hypothetical protein